MEGRLGRMERRSGSRFVVSRASVVGLGKDEVDRENVLLRSFGNIAGENRSRDECMEPSSYARRFRS